MIRHLKWSSRQKEAVKDILALLIASIDFVFAIPNLSLPELLGTLISIQKGCSHTWDCILGWISSQAYQILSSIFFSVKLTWEGFAQSSWYSTAQIEDMHFCLEISFPRWLPDFFDWFCLYVCFYEVLKCPMAHGLFISIFHALVNGAAGSWALPSVSLIHLIFRFSISQLGCCRV